MINTGELTTAESPTSLKNDNIGQEVIFHKQKSLFALFKLNMFHDVACLV